LDAISSCPSPAIKVKSDYFGYIVLDLIKAGKGHAYCKVCKQMYAPSQLTSRPLGFGKSPFSINLREKGGIIKRLFSKKKHISGMGGEAYDCPKEEYPGSKLHFTLYKVLPREENGSCEQMR
jgi:hypothetical protein